jgi:hypothetical protein
VVDYRDIQFMKTDAVLRAQGLKGLKIVGARARTCALKASGPASQSNNQQARRLATLDAV